MSETYQRLITALLGMGQIKLGEIWDVDASEVGRRLNGQRNIPLADFCKAIDELGLQLITPDSTMALIDAEELHALRVLARKAFDRDGEERRHKADRRQG